MRTTVQAVKDLCNCTSSDTRITMIIELVDSLLDNLTTCYEEDVLTKMAPFWVCHILTGADAQVKGEQVGDAKIEYFARKGDMDLSTSAYGSAVLDLDSKKCLQKLKMKKINMHTVEE